MPFVASFMADVEMSKLAAKRELEQLL